VIQKARNHNSSPPVRLEVRMFSPENAGVMEKSFQQFCRKEENQALVDAAQKQEMKQALAVKEALLWQQFESKVGLMHILMSEMELLLHHCVQLERAGNAAQQALSPFLRVKVLRRVLQTFGNSVSNKVSL
jgi:hypothetical protein